MPSTASSWVSMVRDSSTVITPSLPTFFMASAMMPPMVASLLAEMVPTWTIMSPCTGLDIFFTASTAAATALSMPRFSAIGLAPAATFLTPSRKIACASTVAVVVPSPATSLVFEATSRTICAPMFSSVSGRSISLATVTPSLVMLGEPNFFSITTLRPLGPRVILTASASTLTPRRIACRELSPCTIRFAIVSMSPIPLSAISWVRALLAEHAQDFFLAQDQQIFAIQLDLAARVLAEQDVVAFLHVERQHLAVFGHLALANGNDLALLRLFLGRIGDDDATAHGFLFFDPLDQQAVMKRPDLRHECSSDRLFAADGVTFSALDSTASAFSTQPPRVLIITAVASLGQSPRAGVAGLGTKMGLRYTQRARGASCSTVSSNPSIWSSSWPSCCCCSVPRSCRGWGGRWGRRFGNSRNRWPRRAGKPRRRSRAKRRNKGRAPPAAVFAALAHLRFGRHPG